MWITDAEVHSQLRASERILSLRTHLTAIRCESRDVGSQILGTRARRIVGMPHPPQRCWPNFILTD
ncbi:hypothetical protein BD309DRAFT_956331 [Dichomitus squalens]|nr:hypothetical protein BD309DRAFT_956331 [Dichomitus squalens]